MNWLGMVIVGVVGFLIAGAGTALLSGRKPHWSAMRRVIVAALIAPLLILIGAGVGILMALQGSGEMADLAVYALLTVGLVGALVAFVVGLIASTLADRALRAS